MMDGFAVDDGVALHFEGTTMARAVSDRRSGRAYRVELERDSGRVRERSVKIQYIGAAASETEPRAPRKSRRRSREHAVAVEPPATARAPRARAGTRSGVRFAV
jgi:hypothetical protein